MVDLTNFGLGTLNPIRYRGYYYDQETGWYYLQSRYYDPGYGRCLSPDSTDVLLASPMGLTDKNLYLYCDNNPVSRADDGGEFWHILAGAAAGALISGAVKVASNLIAGNSWSDGLGTAMLVGAASGALAATGVGLVGQALGGAAIAMAGNAIQQGIDISKGKRENFSTGELLYEGAVGALSGVAGGPGASQGNAKTAMTLGKQLTKRVFLKKEMVKGFKYYTKNMMNGAGKSIFKELRKGIARSAGVGYGFSVGKTAFERIYY